MKKATSILALLASTLLFSNCNEAKGTPNVTEVPTEKIEGLAETKIQVALLLDTSNSMDGLIDQAKSRLWNIVNTLTTLKYEGKTPAIEISLYEYGNDGLSARENYIRQVTPLTNDLDLISEKLFSLRTNGGSEFCGAVIQSATMNLQWSDSAKDMKLLYISGNEPFTQGSIPYKEAISGALKKGVFVNTIFCGSYQDGITGFWQDGATIGQGKYFNIDSNLKVQYIVTPYDDQITKCNTRLNKTYIGYGSKGLEKKESQIMQDANAYSVSESNFAERAVSKSKAVYKNDSWDLVDKVKEDDKAIEKLKKAELPKELQSKTKDEIKQIVLQKSNEREKIQKEMSDLAKKRQTYIDEKAKSSNQQDDLGNAMATSIVTLAKTKGYKVEK